MSRAAIIGIALTGMLASAASAQQNCAPREAAVKQLAEKWGEARRSVMLASNRIFEVYAGDSGTWTILRTTPDGVSCIVASGVAYEDVSALVEGDPA